MNSEELLKDIVLITLFLALFFIMSVEGQNTSAIPSFNTTTMTTTNDECQ